MKQTQQTETVNPWLVSYIEQHRNNQSRYEIDKYLIETGYNPAEIEQAWQILRLPRPKFKPPKLDEIEVNDGCSDTGKKITAWICGFLAWIIGSLIAFAFIPTEVTASKFLLLTSFAALGCTLSVSKYPKNTGILLLLISFVVSPIAIFTFGRAYLWGIPLAFFTDLAGILAISMSQDVPRWMKKTWRLFGISLIALIAIPMELAAFIHIFI